jgi:hypothetical protein
MTINNIIEELKQAPIDACITGSCLLEDDFSNWEEEPDVDIFAFNEAKYVQAVQWLLDHGYAFGNMKDKNKTPDIEVWKWQMFLDKGPDKKWDVTTIYLAKNGVSCNVSLKYGRDCDGHRYCITKASQIIESFDMNLTMIAYDIRRKKTIDLRDSCGMDKRVGVPNPYRDWDVTPWKLKMWLRQWNRVIKYWNRGFDTRPMARFYKERIDEVLAMPDLFKPEDEEEQSAWELAVKGLPEHRETIVQWLKEKEAC